MSWPIVTRTAVMDEIILRRINEDDIDTVLDLAAGLDARPWRLALPPTLRWIDVDHADMLDYKASVLAGEQPSCRYEAIATDLADGFARRELFRAVGASAKRVLVITEGLLIYLQEAQVTNLARDLHDIPAMQFWLTDLASPGLLEMMEKNWAPVGARRQRTVPLRPRRRPRLLRRARLEGGRVPRHLLRGSPPRPHHEVRLALGVPRQALARRRSRQEFKRFSTIVVYQRA